MKHWLPLLFSLLWFYYSLIIVTTPISLTGYWTDLIFGLACHFFTFWLFFKKVQPAKLQGKIGRILTILSATIFFTYLCIPFFKLQAWNTLHLKSNHFIHIEKRCFHFYYQPAGAGSGGEGDVWITESPSSFPLFESKIYSEKNVLFDYSAQEWDGQKINPIQLQREFIRDKVLKE